jgi:hypothetical protein
VAVIYNTSLPELTKRYWTAMARDAYFKLSEREASGKKGDSRVEEIGLNHLIQVNVEAVVPVYAKDLEAYVNALQNELKKNKDDENFIRIWVSDEELKNPPKDKGWVVEIRGYTYHEKHYEFLRDTLHKNLASGALKERGVPAKKEGDQVEAAKKPDSATPATNGQPADKGETKPAQLTPEQERDELWNQVIAKKIQFVVMYDIKPSQPGGDDSTRFALINNSVVSKLATATSSSGSTGDVQGGMGKISLGGGGDREGRGASGGGGGANWQVLVPLEAGTGSSTGAGGMTGGERMTPGGKLPGGSPTERRPGSSPAEDVTTPKTGLKRSEFILLFVWKEPEWKTGDIGGGDSGSSAANQTPSTQSSGGGERKMKPN